MDLEKNAGTKIIRVKRITWRGVSGNEDKGTTVQNVTERIV